MMKRSSFFHFIVAGVTMLWSVGFAAFTPLVAHAGGLTVALSNPPVVANSFPNNSFPGSHIPASSAAAPILKLSVTAPGAGMSLSALTVNFTGTGFVKTDLAAIAIDNTSGVALYTDSGSGTAGSFDASGGGADTVVTLATAPDWTGSTTNITLTPSSAIALTAGVAKVFYIVVKTSAGSGDTHHIAATIAADAVIATGGGGGTGPATSFTANDYVVDTGSAQPLGIASVKGASGSTVVNVKFSKPVQGTAADGKLVPGDFFYTNGTGTSVAETIAAVNHTPGQDFAILTMSSALEAGDLTASPPAKLRAVASKIKDMAANFMGITDVPFSNPLQITTATVPTAIAGTTSNSGAPLITFGAAGGTTAYKWRTVSAADTAVLTTLGLNGSMTDASDNTDGKLFGTIPSTVSGSFTFNLKVTDSAGTPAFVTKPFTINVAPAGGTGAAPGLTKLEPGGGAQNSTAMVVTVTGVNTHFLSSSAVQFFLSGANDTNITSTVTSSTATSLVLSVNIAAGAATGSRDVKVVTGNENVFFPNGFGVFASGGSGLTLQLPADASTGAQTIPGFSFLPSSNATVNAYRITLKSTSNFAGSALWDYVFPKPLDAQNTNASHCGTASCGVNYGSGAFRILGQPQQLAPNATYYWQVRTYAETIATLDGTASTAVESTPIRSFTTTASVTDAVPPTITHRPVTQANASTDLIIIARVVDNIATLLTTPALTTKLYYCAGASCTADTLNVTGVSLGSGYFSYTIPSATIGAATTVTRYYITASDGTNTSNFYKTATTPFSITSVTAGSATITGSINDSIGMCTASTVQGATIFADGTGFNATSASDCTFTISGMTAGNYDLIAFKDTFGERKMFGMRAGLTSLSFSLSAAGTAGGFGGDTVAPRINSTGPIDGAKNVAGGNVDTKIFLTFSKSMSQSSVTATGALKVYSVNPADGVKTDITSTKGAWAFYSTAPSTPIPGVPSNANMAVYTLLQPIGDGKTISVAIASTVSDTSGNAIQGNQPDGSYSFSFNTGTTVSFDSTGAITGGGTFGSGANVAPKVNGTTPTSGGFNVPKNTKIIINFSTPMADDSSSYVLKNSIMLFTVSGTTETNISSMISTVTLDATKMSATVVLTADLSLSTKYRLKVLGAVKAATGITASTTATIASSIWTTDFSTGTATQSSSDAVAPIIVGSYPDNNATSIPVTLSAANVSFSKDMDQSTITTGSVYLSIGSTIVNANVEYHSLERTVYVLPLAALSPNTAYTLTVTGDAKALNGTAFAATTRTFTTGVADTVAPNVSFMNADDYTVTITFSRPMNAGKATDTINFPTSVLKSANYAMKYGALGTDFSSGGTAITIPATATFSYNAISNTLTIAGYSSVAAATLQGKELYIAVTGVTSISGTAIATTGTAPNTVNTARGTVQNSATTKGELGPASGSGTTTTSTLGTFTPKNFAKDTFGFAPAVDVRPFNKLPGQTTIYSINIPISKQIPSGGTILLTFPAGFDVSGAKQDVNSPRRKDINGPGTGTVTFLCTSESAPTGASCAGATNTDDSTAATQGGAAHDGVTVNTSSNTVTVFLSGVTNAEGHDFIGFDLGGIKNTSTPLDLNTTGYTVDVKTKNGTSVLESLTSSSFYIQSGAVAGATNYGIDGTITLTGNSASGTMKVYLMSPQTGVLEATTTNFNNTANATYSFSNLPPGDYFLYTDQTITLNSTDYYVGKMVPDRITIVNASFTAGTAKNFTFANATTGTTAVTVNITGGPTNEPVDVFASSPNGFRVKQDTLSAGGAKTVTLNLPDGQWNIGIGPQMPKGPMSGPPPAPTYLMPKPKNVSIASSACKVDGVTTCTAAFVLSVSGKDIKGVVKDGSGKLVASAQVYAYSPTGGFGTHATSDGVGAFDLKVVDGRYIVGAFVPGMPPSKEVSVIVTSAASSYLQIDGSTTTKTADEALATFVLKVAKPDFTITGKVTDGTSVVGGASVFAYRTDGPGGGANALTDATGVYTLYVSSGTWKVGAFLPQYGRLTEQVVTVNGANITDQNFSPSQTNENFYSVDGTVTNAGSNVQGAFVSISGNGQFNQTVTASDGKFTFKVPKCSTTGCYTLKAYIQNLGELPALPTFALTADVTGKDFTVTTARTVNVTIVNGPVVKGLLSFISNSGARTTVPMSNAVSVSTQLPDGAYRVQADVPGLAIGLTDFAGTGYASGTGIFTVSSTQTALTLTLPTSTFRTITGTVSDDASTPAAVANAWVELVNPTLGTHKGGQADASGVYSIKVADGTYFINAMKPGYFRQSTQLVVSADATQNLTLNAATLSISGQVLLGSTGVANAIVRADKIGGGFTGTQADASGNYSLPVTAGTWKLYGMADGYKEVALSTPVVITTASATLQNITLSTTVSVRPPKSSPITPASGGTLEDSTAGVKLTLPPNALGTSKSAGNVQVDETNNVRATSTASPLKVADTANAGTYVSAGKDITATDSEKNPITNLGGDATIEMEYTKAELAASKSGTDSSVDSKAEADKLKMAYWDATNQDWTTMPSTVSYKDSSGTLMDSSTTALTPAADLSNVSTVVIATTTDHFTLIAPVSASNPDASGTPTGLAAAAASSTSISLSWTAATGSPTGYDIYSSTTSGGTFTRIGGEPTVSSGSTLTYTDTGLTANTAYFYKISSVNGSGESGASAAVTATTSAASSSSSGGGGGGGGYSSSVTVTASLTVSSPNGGETLIAGKSASILWTDAGTPGYVNIQYSPDNGATWQTIVSNYKDSHSYNWTVPSTATTKGLIRLQATDLLTATISDTSNSTFNIILAAPAAPPAVIAPPAAAPPTAAPAAPATTSLSSPTSEAQLVFGAKTENVAKAAGAKRDAKLEAKLTKTLLAGLFSKKTPADTKASIIAFVSYGTSSTSALTSAARADVVRTYARAFGHVPKTEAEWKDAVHIASGSAPEMRSASREKSVQATFKKIYGRLPKMDVSADQNAILFFSYGLQVAKPNENAEKAAMRAYKKAFHSNPHTAFDWNILRGIAYSGAQK